MNYSRIPAVLLAATFSLIASHSALAGRLDYFLEDAEGNQLADIVIRATAPGCPPQLLTTTTADDGSFGFRSSTGNLED